MTRRLGKKADERLRRLVPPAGQRFATAVVLQLAWPPGAEPPSPAAEIREVDRVGAILGARPPEGILGDVSFTASDLLRRPALLAACFQNVDLLYDAGFDGADAVSALIMEALALAERES